MTGIEPNWAKSSTSFWAKVRIMMPSRYRESTRAVSLHRLSPADLQIAVGQEQRLAAQLVHTRFKGNPGPGGRFLENHAQTFALQPVMAHAVLLLIFQLIGQVQQADDLIRVEIEQFQQMVHANTSFIAATARSISSLVMIRGGSRRMASFPAVSTSTPFSISCRHILLLFIRVDADAQHQPHAPHTVHLG